MLDLIIPVYKNIAGLYRTLMSLGTDYKKETLYVTIVDDASNDDYTSIIDIFQKFYPIRVLKLKENSGPGIARQYGLSHTKEPYVSFIDCGDIFVSPTTLQNMINIVNENPKVVFFSWGHYEEFETGSLAIVGPQHNRMHGKIYKREFLNKYTIKFTSISSYADEDIGFNRNCRLCAYQYGEEIGDKTIYEFDEAATVWKWSGPSITQANNCAFYFQKEAMGIAITNGEAIDNAIAHGINKKIILKEIYETMSADYIFYLSAQNRRPEFMDEVINGCLYFYTHYFKRVPKNDHDYQLLRDAWYTALRDSLNNPEDPIRDKLVSYDILGWLNMLEEKSRNN